MKTAMSMRARSAVVLLSLCVGIAACAPMVSSVRYWDDAKSKPSDCNLDVYQYPQQVSRPVTIAGEINVDDTGFSLNCDAQTVLKIIKAKACEAGADAVAIYNVRHPSMWGSTCYRASASFFKYSSESGSAGGATGTCWMFQGRFCVTCNHVIEGRNTITLKTADGKPLSGSVRAQDKVNDIAIIELKDANETLSSFRISTRGAKVGSAVFSIGYPLTEIMGQSQKLTNGVVNAEAGFMNDPRTYQISVPLQAGNSGGPLINLKGEVVGVVTSKLNAVQVFKWTGDLPQNVNYAIKSAYVLALLSSLGISEDTALSRAQEDEGEKSMEFLAEKYKPAVLFVLAQ